MGSLEKTSELDLRAYVRVLDRRKWIIVFVTILTGLTAFFLANRQTPRYRSTSELLFKASAADLLAQSGNNLSDPQRALATEIKILKGQSVAARVADKIGSAAPVKVVSSQEENVIQITADSPDPKRAAATANAYAQAYIEHRRDSSLDDSLAAQKAIQAKVDDVQGQIDQRNQQIAVAPKEQVGGLQTELQQLLSQQLSFRQQLNQLQLRADLAGGVEIVTQAFPARFPFAPTPKRTAVLAASLGLLLGLGLAFVVDYLDDSIKDKDDLERAAPGVPVIALIPSVSGQKGKHATVVSVSAPNSNFAEAFRTIRTSIQFMALDHPVKLLQVTSPGQGDGKSTTIANLAVAFARAGRNVVAVDCDLRRPRIHEFFDVSRDKGFTSVILGEVSVEDAIQTSGVNKKLRVLASGDLPPNPSELLLSRKATDILMRIKQSADMTLVDSPPILPVTDASILSKMVDGTICVVSAGRTTRRQLHRAVEMLNNLDAKLVGIVLNGITGRSSDYGYSYGYGYTGDERESTQQRDAVRSWDTTLDTGSNGGPAHPELRTEVNGDSALRSAPSGEASSGPDRP